jgi:Ca2+-binding EF-hand superfamily protein
MGACSDKDATPAGIGEEVVKGVVKDAPFLDQYFVALLQFGQELKEEQQKNTPKPEDLEKMLARTPEEWKAASDEFAASAQKRLDALHEKLRPIIENAFNHHDASRDGVIDTMESQAFFAHYVERYSAHAKELNVLMKKMDFETQMQTMRSIFKDNKDMLTMMQQNQEDEAKAGIEKFEQQIDEAIAEYEKDKEAFHKKAFAVIDVNQDGKLVKQEVIECLLSETEKGCAFLNVFPMGPGPMAQKQMDVLLKQIEDLMKQADEEEVKEAAENGQIIFKATVEKVGDGGTMGIDVAKDPDHQCCMKVGGVKAGGPAETWNKASPENAIRAGDVILQVNGNAGTYDMLKEQVKQTDKVELKLRGPKRD